jgi:hypothetical protein
VKTLRNLVLAAAAMLIAGAALAHEQHHGQHGQKGCHGNGEHSEHQKDEKHQHDHR